MKCSKCDAKNDANSKFCKECGAELRQQPELQLVNTNAELLGKEVVVIFFIEPFSGKISGIVNPTEDQLTRYQKTSIAQRVTIQGADEETGSEGVGAILSFIRQSKEFLGEDYNESFYRTHTIPELKKEYLKLFERVLKEKARRGIQ
jgi:hypothetical protein